MCDYCDICNADYLIRDILQDRDIKIVCAYATIVSFCQILNLKVIPKLILKRFRVIKVKRIVFITGSLC